MCGMVRGLAGEKQSAPVCGAKGVIYRVFGNKQAAIQQTN
jgi:hypothetical protein